MRKTLAILALLLAYTAFCVAQKTGPAVANGVCNISISGNNNTVSTATLRACGGIDKEQAEKIIRLLNTILAKKDAIEINAKLDQLIDIAAKPVPQVLNCVGSNCVQNGTQNVFDQRSYGVPKPLPTVINLHTEQLAPVPPPSSVTPNTRQRPGTSRFDTNPGVKATFEVSAPFSNPMFAVWCDRPCVPINLFFTDAAGSGGFAGSGFPFVGTNSPSIWVTLYGMKNMMLAGEFEQVTFRSRDDQPIDVIKVEAYSQ